MQAVYEQILSMGLTNESAKHAKEMSGILVELVQGAPPAVASFLAGLNRIGEAHIRHALGVSILSLVVGKKVGMSEEDMRQVSLAGLMHDIGMLKLDPQVASKCFENMSADELKHYQSHVMNGAAMLKEIPLIPNEVTVAVYEHHENEAGEGYPRQLKKGQISKLGQVISLVDYFCELTLGDAQHNEVMKPLNALNYIENIQGQPYSGNYFTALKQMIAESYTQQAVEK